MIYLQLGVTRWADVGIGWKRFMVYLAYNTRGEIGRENRMNVTTSANITIYLLYAEQATSVRRCGSNDMLITKLGAEYLIFFLFVPKVFREAGWFGGQDRRAISRSTNLTSEANTQGLYIHCSSTAPGARPMQPFASCMRCSNVRVFPIHSALRMLHMQAEARRIDEQTDRIDMQSGRAAGEA